MKASSPHVMASNAQYCQHGGVEPAKDQPEHGGHHQVAPDARREVGERGAEQRRSPTIAAIHRSAPFDSRLMNNSSDRRKTRFVASHHTRSSTPMNTATCRRPVPPPEPAPGPSDTVGVQRRAEPPQYAVRLRRVCGGWWPAARPEHRHPGHHHHNGVNQQDQHEWPAMGAGRRHGAVGQPGDHDHDHQDRNAARSASRSRRYRGHDDHGRGPDENQEPPRKRASARRLIHRGLKGRAS